MTKRFDHTAYAHRTGRRSRPRSPEQMERMLEALDEAIALAQEVRAYHRGKNKRSRVRQLRIAEARLEAAMAPARQEAARNGKDRERAELYGAELRRRTAAARYERLRLKKMLGDWR